MAPRRCLGGCGTLLNAGSYCVRCRPCNGSTRQWRSLREQILHRDRYTSQQCGARASHVDHVVPVDADGPDHPSSLQALCADCNLGKGRYGPSLGALDMGACGGVAHAVAQQIHGGKDPTMHVGRVLRGHTVVSALALILLAVPASAQGVTVTESGDAGSLPASAQRSAGVPTDITGVLQAPGDEDVYRVCLSGGGTFSATTVGSELFDPQLFLFDANGRGVYANDDFVGLQSTLPAGHPLTPTAAGTYFLAITSFNNDPLSSGGEIFGFDFPIQGPDGPGGGSPVSGWTEQGFVAGAYRITLTGTRACLPERKEECKNGGWRDFGVFKNQGDCVSFVATGGKNPPGGP